MSAFRLAAGAAIALFSTATAVAKDRPPDLAPWTVGVEVRWGENQGPDAFRTDVLRALASTLGRGCVAAVVPEPGPDAATDLTLVVVLHGYVEEVSFDDSIAVAKTPGEPGKELRRVASIDLDVDAHLQTTAAGSDVAAKSFHANQSYRPMYLGEDPQVTARARTVEDVVEELTRALCKSKGKLAEKVRATLAADAEHGASER